MKKTWLRKGLKFLVIGLLALTVFTFLVMYLWNWLMPAVFDLKPIGFLQALGLLILSRIFFGGFRGRPGHSMRWRRHMIERWESMTPEEREKFREGMRHRCGPSQAPVAEA